MAGIQGIYLALFGRPADPAGLAYWNEQTKGGTDLAKIIDTMATLPEAVARFASMTPTDVVTSIYTALFDRAPDATGLAFFAGKLQSGELSISSVAISILDGAQGGDLTIVNSRIQAADNFTASLDTPAEIAAYSGTGAADFGRSFIKQVTGDPSTIPSPQQVQTSINNGLPGYNPQGGQEPLGDDGGTPQPDAANLTGGVLTITAGADATMIQDNGTWSISATGFSLTHVAHADVIDIVLSNGATLHVSATILAGNADIDSITGAGTLAIEDVTLAEAPPGQPFEPVPSLDGLYAKVASGFTVNDSEADTIKALWDILDDRYGQAGYYNADINKDFVELGLRYVEYLEDGGTPFSDFSVKTIGGRDQSMHDNLLGNLNHESVSSRFDGEVEADLLARIADEYEARPVYDGNPASVGGIKHDGVRAFDFEKGWDRPDYIDRDSDASVDASAVGDNGYLNFGNGNTADGFNVVRHEGAGIEIALKAKVRGGGDYDGIESVEGTDHVVTYQVGAGTGAAGWGTPEKWSFDFAIATGLNDTISTLGDFKFKALLDIDPTSATNFIELNMIAYESGNPWVLVDDDGTVVTAFSDDDGPNLSLSQNSANYGFNFINSRIDNDPSTEAFEAYDHEGGIFDIVFKAYTADGVTELASNHIRVEVGMLDT